MKLKLAILIGLFTALLTWNYADSPATNGAAGAAAPDAATTAFTKITTDFGALRSAQGASPAIKQNMITTLFTEAADFMKKYPADEHMADVSILWAQMGETLAVHHLPGAPSEAEISKKLDAMATDPKAPERQRAGIRVMQISQAMQKAASPSTSTPAAWDDVEARFDVFEKEFGADYSFNDKQPILPALRSEELTVLQQSPDQARYNALIKKLAASPNTHLSDLAESAEQAQLHTAALKSKPLDLKFTSVEGKPVDVAQMRGKVVLVDFWATWCPPCRGEVPNVVAAYKKYHDKGFEIVGISLDHDKDALTNFTAENGMTWPQYFDGKGWDNEISKGFGIDSIPAMWLLDKKGMVVTMDGREDLDGQVAKLLAAP